MANEIIAALIVALLAGSYLAIGIACAIVFGPAWMRNPRDSEDCMVAGYFVCIWPVLPLIGAACFLGRVVKWIASTLPAALVERQGKGDQGPHG